MFLVQKVGKNFSSDFFREITNRPGARLHPILRAKLRIDFNGNNGCWRWTGSLSEAGYGNLGMTKTQDSKIGRVRAHRFIYLFLTGQSGEGLVCDHLCRNRSCVNPNHIELVTQYENSKRGNSFEHQRLKTHCKYGHPYSKDNTRFEPNGARRCRECNKIRCRDTYYNKAGCKR